MEGSFNILKGYFYLGFILCGNISMLILSKNDLIDFSLHHLLRKEALHYSPLLVISKFLPSQHRHTLLLLSLTLYFLPCLLEQLFQCRGFWPLGSHKFLGFGSIDRWWDDGVFAVVFGYFWIRQDFVGIWWRRGFPIREQRQGFRLYGFEGFDDLLVLLMEHLILFDFGVVDLRV